MKYIWILIVVIVAIALLGSILISGGDEANDSQTNHNSAVEDKLPGDNGSETAQNTPSGEYRDYDESLLTRADSGDVVLFFHAGWCPTCKALERNIIKEGDDIPEDLTILKLDYDSAKDLRDKYSVVIQHTLVQVDSKGNEITKWTGGNDLDSIKKRLK